MRLLLCLVSFMVIQSACGPTSQWVKPGATEEDLRKAIALCDRENIHFGRDRITTMGQAPEEDVMATRQNSYRRGAGDMMREECLENHGWKLEYVD